METTSKAALAGTLATLGIGGLVVAGVLLTSSAAAPVDPVLRPASATGLRPFQDCEGLRAWYVDRAIGQVGPYGWGGRPWPLMRPGAATRSEPMTAGADSGREVANGATGTNTQEAAVDEPDVAKTNGRLVVRLQDGRRLVVTDVTGAEPRQVSEWQVPGTGQADGLLLVGDHVLVTGQDALPVERGTVDDTSRRLLPVPGGAGTDLYDLDLSDPARPRLDGHTTWSGSRLSLRQYGDTVRLVTSTGLPALPFVQPQPGRRTEAEATTQNREIVRGSTIEDWLPRLGSGQSSRPVVGCGEVYHPRAPYGTSTVAVSTFRPGAVEDATAVAVTGAGSEVYSSTDRLYVASTSWGGQDWPDSGWGGDRPMTMARTHLHAFALEGDRTRYVASGVLDGTVRDRWSMDEHDGHLRVAVSWPGRTGGPRDNGIVVLDERDGRLEQVGALRGLGIDEQIQSVRWFDDLAVLVTFRQTDPLYTVDLRDPARPRTLGELKIPGFSAYLHPVGGDQLLGLGLDATADGRSLGAQAAVFDVGDPSRARQVGKVTFGHDSALGAAEDPHAFTWLPGSRAAITSRAAVERLRRCGHPGAVAVVRHRRALQPRPALPRRLAAARPPPRRRAGGAGGRCGRDRPRGLGSSGQEGELTHHVVAPGEGLHHRCDPHRVLVPHETPRLGEDLGLAERKVVDVPDRVGYAEPDAAAVTQVHHDLGGSPAREQLVEVGSELHGHAPTKLASAGEELPLWIHGCGINGLREQRHRGHEGKREHRSEPVDGLGPEQRLGQPMGAHLHLRDVVGGPLRSTSNGLHCVDHRVGVGARGVLLGVPLEEQPVGPQSVSEVRRIERTDDGAERVLSGPVIGDQPRQRQPSRFESGAVGSGHPQVAGKPAFQDNLPGRHAEE